ncbi:uncharacterized protein HD556DRAFT_1477169 [Suillus plorans]|uniref:DUF6533 domain-containing protein n=1 Tax=Suillus plorans TaxID=116603 RepID=A0A9P7J672_9AGAM|nr:uncharacterized protein HD556DRAFT_1477169 [Suillus plorans]KAG1804720.1 hypothetical protein HD556DRAFT_1477169 [Suillus plorans]
MTLVSNDPSLWPFIALSRSYSYIEVAALVAVLYDWALMFGQEVELVWRKRWSLVTIIYFSVRYAAMPYVVFGILCHIAYLAINWMFVVVNSMAGVMMIVRLYAMYQRSRKILVFLIIILLAISITCGVFVERETSQTSGEELILSGTYNCGYTITGEDTQIPYTMVLALYPAWQIFVLFLTVWIVVKHFRELRRSSTGWIIGGWLAVLVQPHVIYAAVSCLVLGSLSPKISSSTSEGALFYDYLVEIATILQMFVLGPRLVLGVREYHAKLVADSDAGTNTTIALQQRVHLSAGGSV